MTVLRHTGPQTTSASLTHIQADRLRAEERAPILSSSDVCTDQHHTQQAALAVEASLEAGSTFDTMDQFTMHGLPILQPLHDTDGVAAWASHSSALTPISRERQQSSTMDFPFFSPYTVFRGNGNSVA
ncbi:hypothetical protein BDR07DRAFT_1490695 [Suillus spraguei]|nr:hypothetical protein BDR07DRAFT_1490695 [Suillus spraguei]